MGQTGQDREPMNWFGPTITAGFGLLFLAGGLVILLVASAEALGPLRWSIGIPLLLMGLANLALLPRFARDRLPADASFQPLDGAGHPVVGTPQVRSIAATILELASTRPETGFTVETSPDSLRVTVRPHQGPGGDSRRWRTTLAPTPDPAGFVNLDQSWSSASGSGWGRVATTMGRRIGGAVTIEIDRDGITAGTSSTLDPSSLVRAAVKQAGATLVMPTTSLVSIVNAAGALLLSVFSAVGAVLLQGL